MHTTTRRFVAIVLGLPTTTAMALAGSPPSHAALTLVSPGEEVDYINPGAGGQFCTIGYVYTGADFHTYAITAGHCRANPTSGYARDKRSGLTGNFVRNVFEPPAQRRRGLRTDRLQHQLFAVSAHRRQSHALHR
jgi:hypothetical protein